MTKHPTTAETSEAALNATSGIIKEVEQAGLGPLAWLEFLSDFNSEVLSFLAERVKEDVKTQHSILHCTDPEELRHLRAEFLQTAIDQYTAETGKLVEIGKTAIEQAQSKTKSGS